MNNKSIRTKAIVLKRVNYSEADRILTLITPTGKISAIAKGSRREKSRLASGIEPLSVNDMVLFESKSNLYLVTSAKSEKIFENIIQNYERLEFSYEAIKLISAASENLSEPEWFYLTEELLGALDNLRINVDLVKGWFFGHYASLMGYELNVMSDVNSNPLKQDSTYRYDEASQGFVEYTDKGNIASEHIKMMRLMSKYPIEKLTLIGGVSAILPLCAQVLRQHAAVN